MWQAWEGFVKIQQLGSSLDSGCATQYLTTFLINDCVAIDAGCLGLLTPVSKQQSVKHVFLSHSHLDHVASLPLFLDNIYEQESQPPAVYAHEEVWRTLKTDLFNDRLWPDMLRIGATGNRFLAERLLVSELPIVLSGLRITPAAVSHVIPTLGFLIEDDQSAVIIASDTGPTERLWELAGVGPFREKLRAVFLECSFSADQAWLAKESKHLHSSIFAAEIAKLAAKPRFITVAVHLKGSLREQIERELMALELADLQIGGCDRTWDF